MSEELIRKLLDFKYGRDLKNPVMDLFHEDVESLIALQKSLGFPLLSTGSLGIEDLIRPFTRSLDCFKQSYENIGDLPIVRWHYTNTFYRQPRLMDKFPDDSRVLLDDVNTLSEKSAYSHEFLDGVPSRIVIPGPVSLVGLVEIDHAKSPYSSVDDALMAAGAYLAQEIEKLPSFYQEIQLDEPLIVWKRHPRRLQDSIRRAYQSIAQVTEGQRRVIVNTYFESTLPVIDFLLSLPVDGVGIDFIATNLNSIANKNFEGKILQAGLIDAQNYVPTAEGRLDVSNTSYHVKLAEALLDLKPEELIITSNTGLEYLPRPVADEKLQQIAQIVKEVA